MARPRRAGGRAVATRDRIFLESSIARKRAGRLEGLVALVTGAGRGIGRAVGLAYAREGAGLILASRTAADLRSAAAEARALGARVLARPTDVGDPGQARRLVAAGVKALGSVDILVNCAGALGPAGPLLETSDKDWRDTMRVNADAPFHLTREALEASMLARGAGCVINVSSLRGRWARAGLGAYTASKFALEALTKVWAEELKGRGIRFYTVDPSATRTPMRAAAYPREDPATVKPPEAVAEAFIALAAPGCAIPTGTAVSLDRHTGAILKSEPGG